MRNSTTTSSMTPVPSLKAAWQDVDSSFERFCLTPGIGAIEQMLCDAQRLAGARHSRGTALATAGVRRRARSASTAVGLRCAGRGFAATATRSRYQAGGQPRPRIGLAAGQ